MKTTFASMLLALLLLACGGSSEAETGGGEATSGSTARATCEAGHDAIASSTECLQDDAVCYELADGSWCTGPSGSHGNW